MARPGRSGTVSPQTCRPEVSLCGQLPAAGEPEDHLAAADAAGITPDDARAQLAAFEALRRHPDESAATDTVRALTGATRSRSPPTPTGRLPPEHGRTNEARQRGADEVEGQFWPATHPGQLQIHPCPWWTVLRTTTAGLLSNSPRRPTFPEDTERPVLPVEL